MMSRKHYRIIAGVIAATKMEEKVKAVLIERLAVEFKIMSAAFKTDTFRDACMKEGD